MGAGEDKEGLPGVFLRKNVMETAGLALTDNMQRLAPLLTPPSAKVGHSLYFGCGCEHACW